MNSQVKKLQEEIMKNHTVDNDLKAELGKICQKMDEEDKQAIYLKLKSMYENGTHSSIWVILNDKLE